MKECLVLNNGYQPVNVIPETDAICLIVKGVAKSVVEDPNKPFRSRYLTIQAPRVIVLDHYVRPTSFKIRPERPTNTALFRRDNYTCQYCGRERAELGRGERLTKDHILPLSRGGKDEWTNITTACSTCNHKRKNNKTPEEAGLTLLSRPEIPISWFIRGKSKMTAEQLKLARELLQIQSPEIKDLLGE